MKSTHGNQVRKRPVNLTLSEDMVLQAKGMMNNLAGVIESLPSDFVTKQSAARLARAHRADAATEMWNTFNEDAGSFADEHSTL